MTLTQALALREASGCRERQPGLGWSCGLRPALPAREPGALLPAAATLPGQAIALQAAFSLRHASGPKCC